MAEQGPLSGQTLGGRYLLGDLLGEGGFGVVYAGRHLLLDRPQAIKVLLEQHFRKPKFRERFLREARTVAALDHPHIVHIDDFGMEEQTSRAYLVMPFVGGRTFHDFLKKRREPLTLEQIVSYLEQVCNALDYAHQRNVVHLDLKPHNLLVHEDGRLLLSDFGLAHLLKQEGLEGGTSLRYGTPHYMAPEHINGYPDRCSDVYALGVILYQMLVSRRPFEGPTPEAVMMQHLTKPPPPLQFSRPELPPELGEVLEKALAKEVAQRYQSAGELLIAFKTALARAQERIRQAEAERIRPAQLVQQEQARSWMDMLAEDEEPIRPEAERIRPVRRVQQQKPVQQVPQHRPIQRIPQRPVQRAVPGSRPSGSRSGRIQRIPQRPVQQTPSPSPVSRRPQRQHSSLRQSVKDFLENIGEPLAVVGILTLDASFLLLGILGFFNVSIIAGFNMDLGHRLICLVIGLVGSALTAVAIQASWTDVELWPLAGYDLIVGLVCLIVGIGGLVNRSFYASYPFLSLTHVNILDSIVGLVIGVPATLWTVAWAIYVW
jgi:serine/threonine protein kinase